MRVTLLRIFSGGGGVIYAVGSDGTLYWMNDTAQTGPTTLTAKAIGTQAYENTSGTWRGWDTLVSISCGRVPALVPGPRLRRQRKLGARPDWSPPNVSLLFADLTLIP